MIIKKPLAINQPKIGKLLREMRLLAGLTQEQFAINLNVRYSTVNRWKNGHYKPSSLAMEKIEGILESMNAKGQSLLVKYLLS